MRLHSLRYVRDGIGGLVAAINPKNIILKLIGS